MLSQPRRLGLLAYLLLARPGPFHRRDTLLALLWPEHDAVRARNALRQHLHHLRSELGTDVLESRGDELAVNRTRLTCDALQFHEAVAAGDLERALVLYRGDLLPGFFVTEAPGLEDWLENERRYCRDTAARAARSLAEQRFGAGEPAEACHWARRAVELAPDDEACLRWAMVLLDRASERAGALRLYDTFAARFQTEFDAALSPQTLQAAAALGGPDPAISPDLQAAPSPDPPPARRTRRRRVALAVAGITVGIAAGVLWRTPIARDGDPNRVVVLPLVVSGRPDGEYLGEALALQLAGRLDGAGPVRAVDARSLSHHTDGRRFPPDDAAAGRRVAVRVSAGLYVLGEVVIADSGVEVRAALYDRARGRTPIARGSAFGREDMALTVTDRVATQLMAATAPAGVAPGLTTSLAAMRAYLAGEAEFRSGRYLEAMPWFQQAVADDPGFVRAQYRLAVAAEWSGQSARAWQAATDAIAHAERLSPRDRALLDGLRAYLQSDAIAAEWNYRNLLSANPADLDAQIMLAETLFHFNAPRGRAFGDAHAPFERAMVLEPANANVLLHLARIAAAEGNIRELRRLVGRLLAAAPDGDRALEARALLAYRTDNRAARRTIEAELDTVPTVVLNVIVNAVAVFAGDIDAAAELTRHFDQPRHGPEWQVRGHLVRATFLAARGRWTDAWAALGEARALDPTWTTEVAATLALVPGNGLDSAQLVALRDELASWYRVPRPPRPAGLPIRAIDPGWGAYLAGLLSIAAHDTAAVHESLAALVPFSATQPEIAAQFTATLQSAMARERRDYWGGLRMLQEANLDPRSAAAAWAFHSLADERLLHAELLAEVGRGAEALQWYGSFPAPSARDLPYLGIARLWEAELAERLDDPVTATRGYRTVLQLWEHGEAGTRPYVEEARRGLARLGVRR